MLRGMLLGGLKSCLCLAYNCDVFLICYAVMLYLYLYAPMPILLYLLDSSNVFTPDARHRSHVQQVSTQVDHATNHAYIE